MMTNAQPASADNHVAFADDDRPRFVDEVFDATADDLGNWWLDLGSVAIPA